MDLQIEIYFTMILKQNLLFNEMMNVSPVQLTVILYILNYYKVHTFFLFFFWEIFFFIKIRHGLTSAYIFFNVVLYERQGKIGKVSNTFDHECRVIQL